MARGGVAFVLLLCLCVATGSRASAPQLRGSAESTVRAVLDEIWTAAATDIQHQVTGMALASWSNVGGTSVSTGQQQHNQTIDPNIVTSCPTSLAKPVAELCRGLAVASIQYYLELVATGLSDDLSASDLWAQIMNQNFQALETVYKDLYSDLTSDWGSYPGATLSAGGGFGWGFTMACNEQVFLSVGGGAGAGVDGSAGNITGGGGGGGGMQAYDSDGSLMFYTSGGGGGGGVAVSGTSVYSPSWGTTSDPGQKLPSDVMQKLTATASACYQSGGLAMQVAAGGGGGVVVVEGSPGSAASLRYGGGFGFTYTYTPPGGTATVPSGSSAGNALAVAAKECRTSCMPGNTQPVGSGLFYACYCPCLKHAFLQVPNQQWANNIICQVPSSS